MKYVHAPYVTHTSCMGINKGLDYKKGFLSLINYMACCIPHAEKWEGLRTWPLFLLLNDYLDYLFVSTRSLMRIIEVLNKLWPWSSFSSYWVSQTSFCTRFMDPFQSQYSPSITIKYLKSNISLWASFVSLHFTMRAMSYFQNLLNTNFKRCHSWVIIIYVGILFHFIRITSFWSKTSILAS